MPEESIHRFSADGGNRMKKVEISGIIVPILTPFKDDESLNIDEFRSQIDRLIEAGVHGIFVGGTNGEAYALSQDEKLELFDVALDQIGGRVPFYAGTGCITTRDTIALSRKALEMGADVLSIITPSFAAANQNELYRHYRSVAEAVDAPIVLYNIPARTGNALSPDTVRRLAVDCPNIVGAKDSSGNFDNMKQYIELTSAIGKDFSVLSGNDQLILPSLVFGGKGGIAGCANVFPHTLVSIYENFRNGDFNAAWKAQDSIRALRNCFKYGNPNTIVKEATRLLGYPVGSCRSPFNDISPDCAKALSNALKQSREAGLC